MTVHQILSVVAILLSTVVAQSRPETRAESRPMRLASMTPVPFPVFGEGSFPCACSFSSDGKFLAIAWPLRIYDLAKRELVHEASSATPSWTPAFSARSDRLLWSSDRVVSTLKRVGADWRSGKSVTLPDPPWESWSCPVKVAWSQDDAMVTFTDRFIVRQWSLQTGEPNGIACGSGKPISAVSLGAAIGVALLTDDGYSTALIENGSVVGRLEGVGIVLCSPDKDSWLVLKRDPTVEVGGGESRSGERAILRQTIPEIWDPKTKQRRARLASFANEGPGYGGLRAAEFSDDGRILVTNGGMRRAAIRNGRTGEVLEVIRHYEGDRLIAFALSPDGKHLLTMGRPSKPRDNGIVLWELTFDQTGK